MCASLVLKIPVGPRGGEPAAVAFVMFDFWAIVRESTDQTMTTVNLSWFIAGEQAGARRWSSS